MLGLYPNPPINLAVNWGDTDIPVTVNESSWLPGPYDSSVPAQAMEEGRVVDNCTVGVQGIQCLNITSQIWLSVVNTI